MSKNAAPLPTVERRILACIYRWGRGSVFCNSDFFHFAKDSTVAWVLYRLKHKGIIRLLMRGLYDYPKYSPLLQEQLAPDLHLAAAALARKYMWHIQPSGNTALNYLGLSLQVPTRLLYFSSGPSRAFFIYGRTLEFKHISGKESHLGSAECELFIQAMKELGTRALSHEYKSMILPLLTSELRVQVESVLPFLTENLRNILRNLLQSDNNE